MNKTTVPNDRTNSESESIGRANRDAQQTIETMSYSQDRHPFEELSLSPEDASTSHQRKHPSSLDKQQEQEEEHHQLEDDSSDQRVTPELEGEEGEDEGDKKQDYCTPACDDKTDGKAIKKHRSSRRRRRRQNDDGPPMKEVFIHFLPEKQIAVYYRRERHTLTSSPRAVKMPDTQPIYNRSMNDLKNSNHDKSKQQQQKVPEGGPSMSGRSFADDCSNENQYRQSDSRSGPSRRSSTIVSAFTTFAALDSKTNTTFITVAPGVMAPIRGAKEVHDCTKIDFYLSSRCYNCNLKCYTIRDASFILCPKCRVVSPLDGRKCRDGGVGLGFSQEELKFWQKEALVQSQQPPLPPSPQQENLRVDDAHHLEIIPAKNAIDHSSGL